MKIIEEINVDKFRRNLFKVFVDKNLDKMKCKEIIWIQCKLYEIIKVDKYMYNILDVYLAEEILTMCLHERENSTKSHKVNEYHRKWFKINQIK